MEKELNKIENINSKNKLSKINNIKTFFSDKLFSLFSKKSVEENQKPVDKELLEIISDIINDEDFKKLKGHSQHIFFNRYEHLLNVCVLSYKMAKFFKWNKETCALAWLLHDYHFTKTRSYIHWAIAAKNAKKFWVSSDVLNIVKSHMYPSGISKHSKPTGRNFWIVKSADSFFAIYEVLYSILHLSFEWKDKIKRKNNQLLLELVEVLQQRKEAATLEVPS